MIGRPAQLRLEPARCIAQLVRQPAHVARQRVARAQIVEHRAANAELGERLETVDALRIEALGGLHQADDARRDQIVDLDVSRKAARETARDLFDVGKELSRVLVAAREQVLLPIALRRLLDQLRRGTVGRLALRGQLGRRHGRVAEHVACHFHGVSSAA